MTTVNKYNVSATPLQILAKIIPTTTAAANHICQVSAAVGGLVGWLVGWLVGKQITVYPYELNDILPIMFQIHIKSKLIMKWPV